LAVAAAAPGGRACHDATVTTIGIIGGGQAATLHADAALQTRGVELIGVGGRPGSATRLATQAGVPDLPIAGLCEADAVIVAVPSSAVTPVLALVDNEVEGGAPVRALLVEAPVPGDASSRIPTQLAANLLHAPAVRRGLRAVEAMDRPHHLTLRVREPRARHRGPGLPTLPGPLFAPGLRVLPLLLSAAAEPASGWKVERSEPTAAQATVHFASGRIATVEAEWSDGSARTELEVADGRGVTTIVLDPLPRVEVDGGRLDEPDRPPLEALGFIAQTDRLAKVATGLATPWPDLEVGTALRAMTGA